MTPTAGVGFTRVLFTKATWPTGGQISAALEPPVQEKIERPLKTQQCTLGLFMPMQTGAVHGFVARKMEAQDVFLQEAKDLDVTPVE